MIWKDIPEYEGIYQVSDTGLIKSLDRYNCAGHYLIGKLLKQNLNKKRNRLDIMLSKEGKSKTYKVHRIVAQTFILMNGNKPYIKHKDGNTTNNNVNNLEWCSYEEIVQSTYYEFGRKVAGIAKGKRPVMMMSKSGRNQKYFSSIGKAIEYLKENGHKIAAGTSISACCKGKQKYAYDHKWKYIDKEKENE